MMNLEDVPGQGQGESCKNVEGNRRISRWGRGEIFTFSFRNGTPEGGGLSRLGKHLVLEQGQRGLGVREIQQKVLTRGA